MEAETRTLEILQRVMQESSNIPELNTRVNVLENSIAIITKFKKFGVSTAQTTSSNQLNHALLERMKVDEELYYEHIKMALKLFHKSMRRQRLKRLKLKIKQIWLGLCWMYVIKPVLAWDNICWTCGFVRLRLAWIGI